MLVSTDRCSPEDIEGDWFEPDTVAVPFIDFVSDGHLSLAYPLFDVTDVEWDASRTCSDWEWRVAGP